MQMGSKKRAAWSKAKSEFLSTATGGDMSDLFAREDERRDALDAERDEAWRYKSCERKNRYDTRAEAEAAGDRAQVDLCDLALAAHETADAQGGDLIGPDGAIWTRTEAREACADAINAGQG